MPLPPGTGVRQILFRYTLPYTGADYELVRSLPYRAVSVNALISDIGQKVTSPQLANQGSRQSSMGNFANLAGQNLPANQPISLRFTNLPGPDALAGTASTVPASAPASERWLLLILVVVVGAGAGFLAAWPFLRRRRSEQVVADEEQDEDALVDELARLDLEHQAGQISDAEYREQRVRLKAQLSDLIRRDRRP
jgi:cytochrome c-type biogenesis protein CcmI